MHYYKWIEPSNEEQYSQNIKNKEKSKRVLRDATMNKNQPDLETQVNSWFIS